MGKDSFSPLMSILRENKLTGPNYVDWKRNLDIVLTAEEYKYVLIENCPDIDANSTEDQLEAERKWKKANSMAKCYMLASMSNVLQTQHEHMDTAYDIMMSLSEMFADKSRPARQAAIRTIMNTRMAVGTPVRDHMLKMMDCFNEAEILGAEIDAQSQTDMILETLPDSFNQFKLNFNMSKMDMTLSELMKELQAAEAIMKPKAQAHYFQSSSKLNPKGKKFKKRQTKRKGQKKGNAGSRKDKGIDVKPKGKCFKCGLKGHWKKDCPKFQGSVKRGTSFSYFIETCLVVDSTDSWIVDSGATNHICNSLQGFQIMQTIEKGEFAFRVGTGAKVWAVAVGDVYLHFSNDRILVLNKVFYVPDMRKNLISVSRLIEFNYSVSFHSDVDISRDGNIICSGRMHDNLFYIYPDAPTLHNVQLESSTSSKRKVSSTNDTYLWHLRLGHINLKRIRRLVEDGPLSSFDFEPFPQCESCLKGKMTKRSFSGKVLRSNELLELVHTDVCGPMNKPARGGYEYFITFTDDYSRYGYVYLMRRKSEAFDKFKQFKAEAELQLGKHIKALRSDRGGEYLLGEFKEYLTQQGIVSQLSAPGTPQQNGVAERRNRTLLDMVRSMMSHATLPISFWGYALEAAAYILNLVPSKSVPRTPQEMWKGRKPSLKHIHIWGCPAYVLNDKATKLEPRSEMCYFIGYPKETRGGIFYHPKEQKVLMSTHARYLEDDCVMHQELSSTETLEEILPESSVTSVPDPITVDEPDIPLYTPEHRRSGRIPRQPERYLGVSLQTDSEDMVEDPTSYDEAVTDIDADMWQQAMKSELDSMYSNHVWELVNAPEGIKSIGCKWIYKRKRGVDGKVETFKARLVAKEYTQKEGIDYEETFSPVAMLKSIRILLSIAASLDLEIWQMDVKTAFLNGSLDESIYMVQPEGFIEKGHLGKVCKLQKSIYGLKQASRSWNIRFDQAVKGFG